MSKVRRVKPAVWVSYRGHGPVIYPREYRVLDNTISIHTPTGGGEISKNRLVGMYNGTLVVGKAPDRLLGVAITLIQSAGSD